MKYVKLIIVVFYFNFILCNKIFAVLPVHTGLQINPNIYFTNTDSSQYVQSQKQWGANFMFRVGFDISKKISIGLGAGYGFAKEDIKFAYYTYGLEINIPEDDLMRNKNVLEYFKSETYKNRLFFNPYITYKIPFSAKIGLLIEGGYSLKFTLNQIIFSNERPKPPIDRSYYKYFGENNNVVFEFENSLYVRPGLYYDVSPKVRFVLNYLSFGYAIGTRANYEALLENYLPSYLFAEYFTVTKFDKDVRIVAYTTERFPNTLGKPYNEFQFLYSLSSLQIGIYLKF